MTYDQGTAALCEQPAVESPWEGGIMIVPSLLDEPGRVDELRAAQELSAVLIQFVAEGFLQGRLRAA